MKNFTAVILILSIITILVIPAPIEAGGKDWLIGGALLGGGFLLGSILGSHDRVIVGPVYPSYPPYPPPVYYPPPVVYQPQLMWIPDHYEWRWQTHCETKYQRLHCYSVPITVFIPGHWEYR